MSKHPLSAELTKHLHSGKSLAIREAHQLTVNLLIRASRELDRLHALEEGVKGLRDQFERCAAGFREEALSYEDDHGNLPMRNAWKAGIATGKASAREHCKEALDRALEAALKGETT